MAFTLAHPAVILNLKNKNPNTFNLLALILGSMSPDFQSFIPYMGNKFSEIFLPYNGHTLKGVFSFDIPSVIISALIYKYILSIPLILSLPQCISKKMYFENAHQKKEKAYIYFAEFILSALIGILSHLIWDGFTHPSGFFVKIFPFIKTYIGAIPIYNILQWLTSILGLGYIVIYLRNIPNKDLSIGDYPRKSKQQLIYWGSICTMGIISTVYNVYKVVERFGFKSIFIFYRVYIVSFLTGAIIGMIIISFIFMYVLNYRIYLNKKDENYT